MFSIIFALIVMPYDMLFRKNEGSGISAGFANYLLLIGSVFSLAIQVLIALIVCALIFLFY